MPSGKIKWFNSKKGTDLLLMMKQIKIFFYMFLLGRVKIKSSKRGTKN